jgi:hypothetical protein
VSDALCALEMLDDGLVPSTLVGLLPDDNARFELNCCSAPKVDEPPSPPMPSGHCKYCGYHFTVPGEICPNCN